MSQPLWHFHRGQSKNPFSLHGEMRFVWAINPNIPDPIRTPTDIELLKMGDFEKLPPEQKATVLWHDHRELLAKNYESLTDIERDLVDTVERKINEFKQQALKEKQKPTFAMSDAYTAANDIWRHKQKEMEQYEEYARGAIIRKQFLEKEIRQAQQKLQDEQSKSDQEKDKKRITKIEETIKDLEAKLVSADEAYRKWAAGPEAVYAEDKKKNKKKKKTEEDGMWEWKLREREMKRNEKLAKEKFNEKNNLEKQIEEIDREIRELSQTDSTDDNELASLKEEKEDLEKKLHDVSHEYNEIVAGTNISKKKRKRGMLEKFSRGVNKIQQKFRKQIFKEKIPFQESAPNLHIGAQSMKYLSSKIGGIATTILQYDEFFHENNDPNAVIPIYQNIYKKYEKWHNATNDKKQKTEELEASVTDAKKQITQRALDAVIAKDLHEYVQKNPKLVNRVLERYSEFLNNRITEDKKYQFMETWYRRLNKLLAKWEGPLTQDQRASLIENSGLTQMTPEEVDAIYHAESRSQRDELIEDQIQRHLEYEEIKLHNRTIEAVRREVEESQKNDIVFEVCEINQRLLQQLESRVDAEVFESFQKEARDIINNNVSKEALDSVRSLWKKVRESEAQKALTKIEEKWKNKEKANEKRIKWERLNSDSGKYTEKERNTFFLELIKLSSIKDAEKHENALEQEIKKHFGNAQLLIQTQESLIKAKEQKNDIELAKTIIGSIQQMARIELIQSVDKKTFEAMSAGETARFAFYDTSEQKVYLNQDDDVYAYYCDIAEHIAKNESLENLPPEIAQREVTINGKKSQYSALDILQYVASTVLFHEATHHSIEKDIDRQLKRVLQSDGKTIKPQFQKIFERAVEVWKDEKEMTNEDGSPNIEKILGELYANANELNFGFVTLEHDTEELISDWLLLTNTEAPYLRKNNLGGNTLKSVSQKIDFSSVGGDFRTSGEELFAAKLLSEGRGKKQLSSALNQWAKDIENGIDHGFSNKQKKFIEEYKKKYSDAYKDTARKAGATAATIDPTDETAQQEPETQKDKNGKIKLTKSDQKYKIDDDLQSELLIKPSLLHNKIKTALNEWIPTFREYMNMVGDDGNLGEHIGIIEKNIKNMESHLVHVGTDDLTRVEFDKYLSNVGEEYERVNEMVEGLQNQTSAGLLQHLWRNTRFMSAYDVVQIGEKVKDFIVRRYQRASQDKIGAVGGEMFKDIPYLRNLSEEFKKVAQSAEDEEVSAYQNVFKDYGLDDLISELQSPQNKDSMKAAFLQLVELGNMQEWLVHKDVRRKLQEFSDMPVYNRDTALKAIDEIWGKNTASDWVTSDSSNWESAAKKAESWGNAIGGGGMMKKYDQWIDEIIAANGDRKKMPNFTEIMGIIASDLVTGTNAGEECIPKIQEIILRGGIPDHALTTFVTNNQNAAPVFALLSKGEADNLGLLSVFNQPDGPKIVSQFMRGERMLHLYYDPNTTNSSDRANASGERHWVHIADLQARKSGANRKASDIAKYDGEHMNYIFPTTSLSNLETASGLDNNGENVTIPKRIASGLAGNIMHMKASLNALDGRGNSGAQIPPDLLNAHLKDQMRKVLSVIEITKRFNGRSDSENKRIMAQSKMVQLDGKFENRDYDKHLEPLTDQDLRDTNANKATTATWSKKLIIEKNMVRHAKELENLFAQYGINDLNLSGVIQDETQRSPLNDYKRLMIAIDNLTSQFGYPRNP